MDGYARLMFAGPSTALKAAKALSGLSLCLQRLDRQFAVFPEFVKVTEIQMS